ncbi:hypothetical protein VP501E541_P0164 [Vibrio phage 501E54-1]|nr:hypothetical protein VP501E541_P0164 [Vibrio phage 501E54-1]
MSHLPYNSLFHFYRSTSTILYIFLILKYLLHLLQPLPCSKISCTKISYLPKPYSTCNPTFSKIIHFLLILPS